MYEPSASASEVLNQERGAFVTLRKSGELRGCIGYTSAAKPLYMTVRDTATLAALRDTRFQPVSASELPQLEYEISVLSPLRRVQDIRQIKVGQHGLLMKNGGTRAFCFRRYRWKRNGIARGSWKKPAPKRACAPIAGRMRTQTSSCLQRWYSARTGRKRLCPRRLCLQAYPRGQESRRQVYRRTEPCGFPEAEHRNEVTAQHKRARASAQQIDSIECAQS